MKILTDLKIKAVGLYGLNTDDVTGAEKSDIELHRRGDYRQTANYTGCPSELIAGNGGRCNNQ